MQKSSKGQESGLKMVIEKLNHDITSGTQEEKYIKLCYIDNSFHHSTNTVNKKHWQSAAFF